jgi:hypothetical protein
LLLLLDSNNRDCIKRDLSKETYYTGKRDLLARAYQGFFLLLLLLDTNNLLFELGHHLPHPTVVLVSRSKETYYGGKRDVLTIFSYLGISLPLSPSPSTLLSLPLPLLLHSSLPLLLHSYNLGIT